MKGVVKMKKKRLFIITAALLFAWILSAVPASAASSATATVPVTLTVVNDYRAVNVTVPAALPVYVRNGQVLTADSARITNNSKSGSVRVTAVEVRNGALKVGDFDSFCGDGKIALRINGCGTRGAGYLTLSEGAFPTVRPGRALDLSYDAKVSENTGELENVEACTVIFTISAE